MTVTIPTPSRGLQWAPHSHAVQFYERDEYLYAVVADYIAEGLVNFEPAVVIATPEHRDGMCAALQDKGFDVLNLRRDGHLTFLDAREAMATFITDQVPDAARFRESIGGILARTTEANRGAPVRAYGEMVDLLWREGACDAAIHLESLWNELASTHAFTLLCAYPMENFNRERHGERFSAICDTHAHVLPAESCTHDDRDSLLRQIAVLQQRAESLKTEIAHRQQLEEEQARLYRLAQEGNRAKDEFLATLSHELRTPLTAILGWARLLRMAPMDAEVTATALETIERSANTQAALIDDILDLSKVVSGKIALQMDLVNVAPIIESAIETVRLAATAKRVTIDFTKPSVPVFITGDPTRLQQIAWNLIANAIKFSSPDSVVTVRLEQSATSARLVVRDEGCGIRPEFLPHVFEAFRQAEASTTRRYGGLGLGLAIVKHFVEMHGGTILAESAGEGLGATFAVTLPLADARLAKAVPVIDVVEIDLAGTSVLVVDDDDDTRTMVAMVLTSRGADVRTASSVAQARELLEAKHPDVLVTDIAMPSYDGYALIEHVRREGNGLSAIPVIALTAMGRPEDEARVLAAGFSAFARKPVEPSRLTQLVASVL